MSKKTTNPRINFATSKILEYPDLLEVQLKSFKDFFQLETTPDSRREEGLYQVFQEIFPIEDTRNNYELTFIDYFIDPPQYSIEECLERGLTYNVPLKAKLRLSCTDPEHEDFDTRVQDVYLGNIPYMTPAGTFIINGSERIIVSQLHRSPGVFFDQSMHANGTKLYSARIIPFKGSWIEFATDINNVMYAYIDRKKKLPVTTLLRAISYSSDKDILDRFGLADAGNSVDFAVKEVAGELDVAEFHFRSVVVAAALDCYKVMVLAADCYRGAVLDAEVGVLIGLLQLQSRRDHRHQLVVAAQVGMAQKLGMARQQLFIYMYAPAHVIIGIHLLTQLHVMDDKFIVGLLQIRYPLAQRIIFLFVVLMGHSSICSVMLQR